MATKTYNFPFRFSDKTQKNRAKKLAVKNRNSLNGYLQTLVDADIKLNEDFLKINNKQK